MKKRLIDFVDGYEQNSENMLGKRFSSISYSGTVTHGRKQRANRRMFRFFDDVWQRITYLTSKNYGAMSLSFGLVTIVLSFLKDYGSATGEEATLSFIIGIGFALLAIPLLLSDEPLSLLLQNIKLTDLILFEFLRVNRAPNVENPKTVPTYLAVLFGVVTGLLGYVVPAFFIALGFVGLLFLILAFASPEFSVITTLTTLPIIAFTGYSGTIIAALVAVTFLSFARKVAVGKRVFIIEQYDLLLTALAFLIILSGIFNKGIDSFSDALVEVSAVIGCVLASNIIIGRRLMDNAFIAISVSSIPVCAVSIGQLARGISTDGFLATLDRGIPSMFSNTGVLAIYLIAVIVVTASMAKESSGRSSTLYVLLSVISSLCLIMTGEAFAIFALLIGILARLSFKLGGFSVPILMMLLGLPYLLVLISVFGDWIAYASNSNMLSILPGYWKICLSVLKNNLWFGIGVGEESFAEEMGGGALTDAQNLFLELGMEAGVLAVIVLALIFIVRIRHRLVYGRYMKNSDLRTASSALSCAMIAFMAFGAVDYIWSDPCICLLFWCLFGFGSASLRASKQEHDDRVLYYEDTRSHHSSAVDVEIA